MKGQAGFTLVELLVAFLLLGLLLTIAGAGLRNLGQGFQGGMDRVWWQQDMALAGDILRRQAMLALGPASGPQAPGPTFAGSREQVRFAILDRAAPGRGGLTLVSFHLDRVEGGATRLIYSQTQLATGRTEQRVLLSGRFDLDLAYLAADGAAGDWVENWPAGQRRPALVRMTISGEGRTPVVQMARFAADADLSCLFIGVPPRMGRGPGCPHKISLAEDDGIDRDDEAAEGTQ